MSDPIDPARGLALGCVLGALLREQGWEPESNVCRCGHLGGDHTSWGNFCLVCQPPESDVFASFSEKELWANAAARLIAAGVTLAATPAPLDVTRLADALTVLPQTAWDPCMAASVDEVAAAIAAAYAEEEARDD